MILNKEQIEALEQAAKPLMKFLAENFHPHAKVIVESNKAEIVEGSATVICDDYKLH
jgi:hypothetical protein